MLSSEAIRFTCQTPANCRPAVKFIDVLPLDLQIFDVRVEVCQSFQDLEDSVLCLDYVLICLPGVELIKSAVEGHSSVVLGFAGLLHDFRDIEGPLVAVRLLVWVDARLALDLDSSDRQGGLILREDDVVLAILQRFVALFLKLLQLRLIDDVETVDWTLCGVLARRIADCVLGRCTVGARLGTFWACVVDWSDHL